VIDHRAGRQRLTAPRFPTFDASSGAQPWKGLADRGPGCPRARRGCRLTLTIAAAVAFTVTTVGVVLFQLALALGAPWGAYAMGGTFPGRYPPAMRVAAVGQAALLATVSVVVLSEAGIILPSVSQALPWLIWMAVVFSAVGVVVNMITPSAGERRIWVPVAVPCSCPA
jgi:hypothetical protein